MAQRGKKNDNKESQNKQESQHVDHQHNEGHKGPQLFRHHSYIADLSFETFDVNQHMFAGIGEMHISYGFDVDVKQVGDTMFIVALKIKVKVEADQEKIVMLIELRYEGLFELRIEQKTESEIRRILLVDAVEILFPYAAIIVANTTRESGFSPIMMEKLDFAGMYEQRYSNEVLN